MPRQASGQLCERHGSCIAAIMMRRTIGSTTGRGKRGAAGWRRHEQGGAAACSPIRPRKFKVPGTDLDAACRELDADGGLRLQRELVAREPAEQVGLADARVADEHHLEQVVVTARTDLASATGWRPIALGFASVRETAAMRIFEHGLAWQAPGRIRTRRPACDSSCPLFTAAHPSGEPLTRCDWPSRDRRWAERPRRLCCCSLGLREWNLDAMVAQRAPTEAAPGRTKALGMHELTASCIVASDHRNQRSKRSPTSMAAPREPVAGHAAQRS